MSWISTTRIFLTDVKGELKRTTFPSQREVKGTTTVVIITVWAADLIAAVEERALWSRFGL